MEEAGLPIPVGVRRQESKRQSNILANLKAYVNTETQNRSEQESSRDKLMHRLGSGQIAL